MGSKRAILRCEEMPRAHVFCTASFDIFLSIRTMRHRCRLSVADMHRASMTKPGLTPGLDGDKLVDRGL